MSETVKVLICCTERVTYNQVVTMSREDFEKWDAKLDDEDEDEYDLSGQIMDIFIDRSEPSNDDDYDVFEFRIYDKD